MNNLERILVLKMIAFCINPKDDRLTFDKDEISIAMRLKEKLMMEYNDESDWRTENR